ncbi:LLM class flavin-dependent oxidoreductase [Metabacillus sediminilitoris]|uniref:LLM class flavin-dependent oxidoreductase n=1 Tax=Metabacillus sediminilitoris TaxID=2567941 RepID=A0A4S4BQD6_9BACI|nr:LLM class flavin-dependent oxidoreductase [Metabacillus sediminilitoris]QGQ48422.1 LLM class flavin-dependent oxidoreductase [Metabacillus sediminilitoris]THF76319.1 LLM class flavin-dependent oxidoreductase [Metabacillus sediminilitoris]
MKEETGSRKSGIEIGLYSLADIGPDPHTGRVISSQQRIREIIEAAKLADGAGLDVFGVGEHHRLDYAVSATSVVLAAIAQVTKHNRLTSTTTVLSTVDPVRLFEDFATLDLLSDGRAEIIAGRGAFVESFPLFGYHTNDYDALFTENIDLLLKLNKNEKITWSGRFRSSLKNAEIAPRPVQNELPVWVGVGGTPESAARAGRLGVWMAMAILGGDPIRFKPLVDLYRQAGKEAGHKPEALKIGVTGHGYFANTTQQAKDEFYPYYANYWSYVNRQRGMGFRMSREDFEQMTASNTALFVGSPQQIIEKILQQYELFGHQRFIAQIDIGGMPFKKVAEGIELLATKIAPIVRKATSK